MDNYVPEEVQLPTLVVCNKLTAAFDESFLEDEGLPKTMLDLVPLNLNDFDTTKTFPDLDEIWDKAALHLNVTSRTIPSYSGIIVSKVNTFYQGRCFKIQHEKPYPGGKKISSTITLRAGNFFGALINVFIVYDFDIAGIIVDYTTVPYHEVMMNNG